MTIVAMMTVFLAAAPSVGVLSSSQSAAFDASAVDDAVRGGISERANVRLAPASRVQALVASAVDNGIVCDLTTPSCAARIGAFGGLDFMLVADVAGETALSARMVFVDCQDGRTVRTMAAPLSVAPAVFSDGLGRMARAAIGDGMISGTLVVTAPPERRIMIDDVDRGAGSLELDVEAGPHRVSLVPGGAVVDVTVAVADRVVVDLTALTGGGVDVAWPARLGLGLTVVSGAVAVGAGVGAVVVAPVEAERDGYSARAYNDAVNTGRTLVGVSVGAVVIAGVGVALWLWPGAMAP